MATSASVTIKEGKKTLVNLYVHSDGYGHGLGMKLLSIISNGKMTNGIRFDIDQKLGSQFNGAGCLAASIISILKNEPGNLYVTSGKEEDCDHEYIVAVKKDAIVITLDGEKFYESKFSLA